MYSDHSAPLRHPRRRLWERDPRSALLALLGTMVALVVMAGAAYGSGPAAPLTVRVQPGDTIWGIASTHFPGDDTRRRVDDIVSINHLSGPYLVAGQAIVLPR